MATQQEQRPRIKLVNRNKVRAQLNRGEKWTGYLAGSNINAYHINSGWHLGYMVELTSIEQLEKTSADILLYLDSELGNRIVCWQIVPARPAATSADLTVEAAEEAAEPDAGNPAAS